MFSRIVIEIDLNDEMEAAMPKSGPEEMEAIDKHSAAIEKAADGWLAGARQDLEALGYKVEIET